MKTSEQTIQQIERALRKIAAKFPPEKEAEKMTDIHLRVSQETGEIRAYNDDEEELDRCVVEEWINNPAEDFYQQIPSVLRKCIEKLKDTVESMSILKPFSLVLEDDDKETVAELYLVDDETVIIDPDLMEGLEDDLNSFLEKLLAEELFCG
jgi:quinol monooxygenase YgiN